MNQDLVIPENYIIGPDNLIGGAEYSSIDINENITPQIYLRFAIKDFESAQGDRSNVNAFANAKRAIHFQIDIISKAFGIGYLPEKHRDNFPKKITFCDRCGIVGSRILDKFNKIRNNIEHEYYLPKNNEVENIIDVAELLFAATARFISMFPNHLDLELKPKNNLNIPSILYGEFPANKGAIYLFPDINKNPIHFKVTQGEQYFKWVNFFISYSLI